MSPNLGEDVELCGGIQVDSEGLALEGRALYRAEFESQWPVHLGTFKGNKKRRCEAWKSK